MSVPVVVQTVNSKGATTEMCRSYCERLAASDCGRWVRAELGSSGATIGCKGVLKKGGDEPPAASFQPRRRSFSLVVAKEFPRLDGATSLTADFT